MNWKHITLAAIFVASVVAAYLVGDNVADQKCASRAASAAVSATNAARELERKHAENVASIRSEYAAKFAAQEEQNAKTFAGLSTGDQRIRVRVVPRCLAVPTDSATPTGTDDTGAADLAPECAQWLYSIAAKADRCAQKLTALQSWAKQAAQTCGGTK